MIEKIVLENLHEITGLKIEELKEYMDVDLFVNGILDSISAVSLIALIENDLNIRINISELKLDTIKTINNLILLCEDILNK